MPTARTYDFEGEIITATFDHPDSVVPEDAAAALANAVIAVGGVVWQDFDPTEQTKKGDPGYIGVDMRIELPGLARVWVEIECPTDEAFA